MTNATKTERPSNVIDAKTFWRTLGERAIGATIVTAQGADGPAGFLGLSATHVCADPPSMLVSIDRKTSALVRPIPWGRAPTGASAAISNSSARKKATASCRADDRGHNASATRRTNPATKWSARRSAQAALHDFYGPSGSRLASKEAVPQFEFFRRVMAFPRNPRGSRAHPRTALTRSR